MSSVIIQRQCSFCATQRGDKAARIVYRDDTVFTMLDHRPLFPGHVLVIPTEHVETLNELPRNQLLPLFGAVQAATRALESSLGAQGSFVAINNRISQSVPHLHVHVVPRSKGDGLRGFFWPRVDYESDDERERIAWLLEEGIRGQMESL